MKKFLLVVSLVAAFITTGILGFDGILEYVDYGISYVIGKFSKITNKELTVTPILEEVIYVTYGCDEEAISERIRASYDTNGEITFELPKLELGMNGLFVDFTLGSQQDSRLFTIYVEPNNDGLLFGLASCNIVNDRLFLSINITNNIGMDIYGVSNCQFVIYDESSSAVASGAFKGLVVDGLANGESRSITLELEDAQYDSEGLSTSPDKLELRVRYHFK